MSTLNGQELQIFRAGSYGDKGTYTRADLQQLASDYDPAKHEVPLVIGHPKVNAPAFGWLKSMRAAGDVLFGTFEKVPPVMDRAVESGAYKKRSVALRRLPDGKLELRHVGYLGAVPPEVQGLMDATFADQAFEEVEFSTNPGEDMAVADEQLQTSITQGIKDFFTRTFGSQPNTAAATFSVADQSALEQRVLASIKPQLDAKDAEIAALKTQQASFAASTAQAGTQQRIDSAISGLKANKRWLPAYDHMGVAAVFAALGASTTVDIEFSSGEGDKKKTEKLDPVAAFARFLDGLGQIVPEGTKFNADETTTARVTPTTVAEGVPVDAGSKQFDADIRARMKSDNVGYSTAYQRLTAEGKSSASYAGASAGAV